MLRNPLERRKRPLDLLRLQEALEDVVLEIPIARPFPFRCLKGQTCVPHPRDFRDMALLFDLPTSILRKNGKDGRLRMEAKVLALHLALGRLPCGRCGPGPRPLYHQEVLWIDRSARRTYGMQKGRRAQIDPPALRGMFHVGVGLCRVEREPLRAPHETRLKYI